MREIYLCVYTSGLTFLALSQTDKYFHQHLPPFLYDDVHGRATRHAPGDTLELKVGRADPVRGELKLQLA